jgi:hypothetical protein
MGTIASDSTVGAGTMGAHRRSAGRYLLPLATGIVLLVAQEALCFFPRAIFLGFEIVAFALASAAFAYRGVRSWWLAALLVAGPAVLVSAFTVSVLLGPDKLSRGIGSSWLLALGLVPLAAIVGAYVARRLGAEPRR